MAEYTLTQARRSLRDMVQSAVRGEETIIVTPDGRRAVIQPIADAQIDALELTPLGLLSHLDAAAIRAFYADAPGRELEGKFLSPESSSALAANAFGLFVDDPGRLPPMERMGLTQTARMVRLEALVRFPWSGGRHPCLDVLIETAESIIGVESKRYEPFRAKGRPSLSDAYWRDVWGSGMVGYQAARDRIAEDPHAFGRLDAAQLVKHALGLRTQALAGGKTPILVYMYSEPSHWGGGGVVDPTAHAEHRRDLQAFAELVAEDEVAFKALSYKELLEVWEDCGDEDVEDHAWRVRHVLRP